MDKYIIGENAGKVWRLLNSDHLRKWEFSEIKKITGMDDAELGSAIGNPGWSGCSKNCAFCIFE